MGDRVVEDEESKLRTPLNAKLGQVGHVKLTGVLSEDGAQVNPKKAGGGGDVIIPGRRELSEQIPLIGGEAFDDDSGSRSVSVSSGFGGYGYGPGEFPQGRSFKMFVVYLFLVFSLSLCFAGFEVYDTLYNTEFGSLSPVEKVRVVLEDIAVVTYSLVPGVSCIWLAKVSSIRLDENFVLRRLWRIVLPIVLAVCYASMITGSILVFDGSTEILKVFSVFRIIFVVLMLPLHLAIYRFASLVHGLNMSLEKQPIYRGLNNTFTERKYTTYLERNPYLSFLNSRLSSVWLLLVLATTSIWSLAYFVNIYTLTHSNLPVPISEVPLFVIPVALAAIIVLTLIVGNHFNEAAYPQFIVDSCNDGDHPTPDTYLRRYIKDNQPLIRIFGIPFQKGSVIAVIVPQISLLAGWFIQFLLNG